jgi:hypothetical protein
MKGGRGIRTNGRRNGAAIAAVSALRRGPREEDQHRGRQVPGVRGEERREEDRVHDHAADLGEAARDRGERDEERQRDGVRVEVPEPEREERPLGDGVRDAARGRPHVHRRESARGQELPEAIHRTREDEERRPARGEETRAAAEADRRETRRGRHPCEQRSEDVVRDLGREPGDAHGQRDHPRAEVVVREARAHHPGVADRERGRRQERVQDREVHRLLGLPDVPHRVTQPHEEEEREEEDRERQDHAPPALQNGQELLVERDEKSRQSEPSERRRHAADRHVRGRREKPAGERRRHEPDRQAEAERRVAHHLRVRLLAKEPREEGRSGRVHVDDEDDVEEEMGSVHGAAKGSIPAG